MRKNIMSLLFAMTGIAGTSAGNYITAGAVAIPQGGTGTVSVSLVNDKAYTAFSAKLELPEGLTILSVGKSSRMTYSHSLSVKPETGIITCLSLGNESFIGNNGVHFTITIAADASLMPGTVLKGQLTELDFSTSTGEECLDDVAFIINIGVESDSRVVMDENALVSPIEATDIDVLVKRTIRANEWSTLVLPFDMSETQLTVAFGHGVQLADFKGYEVAGEAEIKVLFERVSTLEANRPYIIKVPKPISEFEVSCVDIRPNDDLRVTFASGKKLMDFVGTYVANFNFYDDANNIPLFLSGNRFWCGSENSLPMKAFRGYFDINHDFSNVANSRAIIVIEDSQIDGVHDMESTVDGEQYFNLQGMPIQTQGKGLYIRQGKKVHLR